MAKNFEGKGIDAFVLKERRKHNIKIRTIAKNIMNDLAEAGPVWSGEFRDSYIATSLSTGISGSGSFPYKVSDIPQLKVSKRDVERVKKIRIGNTAEHARVAMDLEVPKDDFQFPGYGPEGEILFKGIRPDGGKRGQIEGGGNRNKSTAPLDWYTTYMKGGKMQRRVKQGIVLSK